MPGESKICPLSGQKIIRSASCTIADFINYCEDGIVYTSLKSRKEEFDDAETMEYLNTISSVSEGQAIPIVADQSRFPGWTQAAVKVLLHDGMKIITNGAFIVSPNGSGAGLKVMGALEAVRAVMNGDGSRINVYFKSDQALSKCRNFVMSNYRRTLTKKINEKLDEDDIKVFAGLLQRLSYNDIMEKYGIPNYNRVATKAKTIFEKLETTNTIAIHEAMQSSVFKGLIAELMPEE